MKEKNKTKNRFKRDYNSLPNRIPNIGRTLIEQIEEIDRFVYEEWNDEICKRLMYGELK